MKLNILFFSALFLILSCKDSPKKDNKIQEKTQEKTKKSPVVKVVDTTSNMMFFKGGMILIGSENGGSNEAPVFETQVASFHLDKNLVSVADFRKFVEATHYKTEADKFGDSGVFSFDQAQWKLLKGANWEYPLGETKPKSLDNHPVTHVSWNDAEAYSSWIGKRLPTEFEYEFAAKNGGNYIYPWGNTVLKDGNYMANVWQGFSVQERTAKDGFLLTSPIGYYGEAPAGLTDMVGNVWQWTESVYTSYPGNPNPEPIKQNIRTTRGGSFMFDQALEKSFTTTFRAKNSTDTSLFNLGFRCAK
ncbi:SUMF1/EgtB/PvdO family nonheme iron enzyme [Flavicella sp.]|uniref:formylglycine-generating enzyme family protein n=1 Tax=Flavicella sp. TaxID=2957742 RepID=UPI003018634E